MAEKRTHEAFLEKAAQVHGQRYTYPDSYVTGLTKLRILCADHGEFLQTSKEHLKGSGCPVCAQIQRPKSKQLKQEVFFNRCRKAHQDKYTYPDPFTGVNQPLRVECPKHGEFTQLANNHMRGIGCPKCKSEKLSRINLKSHEHFLERARKVHGDKYTYPQRYTAARDSIEIICPTHGSFEQLPEYHTNGYGCGKCGGTHKYTLEEFADKARRVHANKYDYLGPYKGMNGPMPMVCPVHGVFLQSPGNHLQGKGCSRCTHHYSKPHQELEALVASMGFNYISSCRSIIPPREIDIFIPEVNLGIEFNGDYWHSLDHTSSAEEKFRHLRKFNECASRGVDLLQISEYEWRNPATRAVWESVIASKLGSHSKVAARKTKFTAITHTQANDFLAVNHLQGGTPATRFCFGLEHKGNLIGVITFAYHEKKHINLTRLAFPLGVTVVGGASKLFQNAIRHLPQGRDVITFSNNLYSSGNVYAALGFEKEVDLPPSYQWFFNQQVYNKRRLRHKYLPIVLGDLYDPTLTEHQNMYRAGARCLYDAGYQRWVFRRKSGIPSLENLSHPAPIFVESPHGYDANS